MAHGLGDHAVNLGGAREFFDAVDMAERAGADLAGGGALRLDGRGVGEFAAEDGGKDAAGKPEFAHRHDDDALLGERAGGGQDARVVGGLARGGDDLVEVGGRFEHARDDGIHQGRGFEVVIGNDDVGAGAKRLDAVRGNLRGLDFDIDGGGALIDGAVKDGELLFDAAVEFAVVLVAAAGGEDDAVGELIEEVTDGFGAAHRLIEEVEAEFKKGLAGLSFSTRVLEELGDVRQTQGDTDARERPRLRHAR